MSTTDGASIGGAGRGAAAGVEELDGVPARYWHGLDDGRVQCDLCPRECRLRVALRGGTGGGERARPRRDREQEQPEDAEHADREDLGGKRHPGEQRRCGRAGRHEGS